MYNLSSPSIETAEKINAELGYDEKIEVMELDPYSGGSNQFLYSFKELVDFLDVDLRCLTEMRGFMRFIEPDELCRWIDNTLGDNELADAIRAIVNERVISSNPVEMHVQTLGAINPIKDLLSFRLAQCRKVLEQNCKVQEEMHEQ